MRHGGDEREEAEEAGDEREQRGIWRRKTVTPRGKNKGEEEMDDDKKGVGDRWKWQKKKKKFRKRTSKRKFFSKIISQTLNKLNSTSRNIL